jgi:hypothetical protein
LKEICKSISRFDFSSCFKKFCSEDHKDPSHSSGLDAEKKKRRRGCRAGKSHKAKLQRLRCGESKVDSGNDIAEEKQVPVLCRVVSVGENLVNTMLSNIAIDINTKDEFHTQEDTQITADMLLLSSSEKKKHRNNIRRRLLNKAKKKIQFSSISTLDGSSSDLLPADVGESGIIHHLTRRLHTLVSHSLFLCTLVILSLQSLVVHTNQR